MRDSDFIGQLALRIVKNPVLMPCQQAACVLGYREAHTNGTHRNQTAKDCSQFRSHLAKSSKGDGYVPVSGVVSRS